MSSDVTQETNLQSDIKVNYYEILNVTPSASRTEIRESYVRLKNTYNNQNQALYSLMSDEDASVVAQQIELAFNVLNDDHSRRNHDRDLGLASSAGTAALDNTEQYRFARTLKDAEQTDDNVGGAYAGQTPRVSFAAQQEHTRTPSTTATVNARNTRADKSVAADTKQRMQQLLENADLGDGATFLALREICEVSENEMQDRTKICVEHIRGIERNTYERLPRPIFVKGFLRSYLKYLGVPDAERLVKAYAERIEHWQNQQPRRS